MNFLFVTDELPRPGLAGHLALNHAIIAWLREQGHEITVLLVGDRLTTPVERYDTAKVAGPDVANLGKSVIARSPRAVAKILARLTRTKLPPGISAAIRHRRYGSADAVLGAFITPAAQSWCAQYIEKNRPDAVLIDTIFRSPLLAAPPLAGLNSVIIAHDVFFRRHLALQSAGYRVYPPILTRESEAALLNNATSIAAIQPEEAEIFREMCPDRQVFTAPMPACPCLRPAGTDRIAGRLVFVGSASLPNLDGLRWFFDEVWPRLRGRGSKITLDLAGDCGPALAKLPEGVTRLGRIADLAPILHRAALAIAPLRVGSGLKIKLLDYARHGLLTIGTPPSTEGFAADPAAPFITATGGHGFAAAIIRQSNVPPDDSRAIAYINRHYGTVTCFNLLASALRLPASLPFAELRRAE